eukprot:scaffold28670_cov66-Phaeocystis_antarctica.AAC.4
MQRLALQQFVVTISNVVSFQHFGEIITRQQHRGGTQCRGVITRIMTSQERSTLRSCLLTYPHRSHAPSRCPAPPRSQLEASDAPLGRRARRAHGAPDACPVRVAPAALHLPAEPYGHLPELRQPPLQSRLHHGAPRHAHCRQVVPKQRARHLSPPRAVVPLVRVGVQVEELQLRARALRRPQPLTVRAVVQHQRPPALLPRRTLATARRRCCRGSRAAPRHGRLARRAVATVHIPQQEAIRLECLAAAAHGHRLDMRRVLWRGEAARRGDDELPLAAQDAGGRGCHLQHQLPPRAERGRRRQRPSLQRRPQRSRMRRLAPEPLSPPRARLGAVARGGRQCKGREPVDHVCRRAAPALLAAQAARPVHKGRRAHAALEGRALAATQPAVADGRDHRPAVISQEEHERARQHTRVAQRLDGHAKGGVHRLDHREVPARLGRVGGGEARHRRLGCLHRRVRRVEREPQEERPVRPFRSVLPHDAGRLGCEELRRVALLAQPDTVAAPPGFGFGFASGLAFGLGLGLALGLAFGSRLHEGWWS